MNFIEASEMGFETFAECKSYSDALVEMFVVMEETYSNVCCICQGDDGETPYKLMTISHSKNKRGK